MTKRSRTPSPQPRRTRRQQSSHPAAAATYPRWVLLVDQCVGGGDGDATDQDAKTVAVCRNSAGDPIRVSVHIAAPPALSRIRVQARDRTRASVTAAHGDSVLLHVGYHEYFVYSAGDVAAERPRPPSLFLLPPCYHGAGKDPGIGSSPQPKPSLRYLYGNATGVTRRGVDDDLVVAFLGMVNLSDEDKSAELVLLRHGEWTVKWPVIVTGERKRHAKKLRRLSSWDSGKVVSVGDDGLMCWVHFRRGLMFSNVFDETPKLQYVPPPTAEAVDPQRCRRSSQDLCVTSDGTVKFIRVSPRCCCGSSGGTHCRHSNNAYTIRTGTLKMDDMAWVMDGMVDATELWALDAYESLPRILLAYPMVSLDEPHVIFFRMSESFCVKKNGDKTQWQIEVDMRSKMIRSVCPCKEGLGYFPAILGDTPHVAAATLNYYI